MTGTREFKTRQFEDGKYWCPFRSFNLQECGELVTWMEHYKALGIRTRVFAGRLWVHMKDDATTFRRDMPATYGV